MEYKLNTEVSKELQVVGLDKVNVNLKDIEAAITLNGRSLSSIPDEKLSAYVYNLAQYQLYIQLHYNIRNVEYTRAKVAFERALNKAIAGIEGKQTIKEKTAKAMEDINLLRLEENMLEAETKLLIFHKIPETFTEVANALKKELGLRVNNAESGNFRRRP